MDFVGGAEAKGMLVRLNGLTTNYLTLKKTIGKLVEWGTVLENMKPGQMSSRKKML